jgi:hypothetical protein
MLTMIDGRPLAQMDADWCASNYLLEDQICPIDNPRLKEPFRPRSMVLSVEPDG